MTTPLILRIALPEMQATEDLARFLAPQLRAGDTLALSGELGAGKTCFARALLQVLGADEDIPSPTFSLVQSYELGGLPISHFDLYRLNDAAELDELGWDEIVARDVCIIEWSERAGARLPAGALQLHFDDAKTGRSCTVTLPPEWQGRSRG